MNNLKMFTRFCKNSVKANDVDPAISYINYMVDRMEFNEEQVLWLCFLYAVTYHLPSAYLIWSEFPDLEIVGIHKMAVWWDKNQSKIPFQTDKMKQRKNFVDTVQSYKTLVGSSQKEYFDELLSSDDPEKNFNKLWIPMKSIAYFGRFSIWNWCQALKHVAGYNIEPLTLMIGEPDSTSFTDGLAYAFGYIDKVTQRIDGKKVYHNWDKEDKKMMESKCEALKLDLNIDNFQLETLACAFKKIWRNNDSRYVGYYNDRIAEDINKTAANWNGVDWKLLWDAREYCVPITHLNNDGVDKKKFLLDPTEKICT